MSCERKVRVFEVEQVRIECFDKKELEALENSVISIIEQKLEKINILIKNCDVYRYNDLILVNDRFNICPNLIEVAEAFGLSIKQIQCSLKGKTYVLSDDLLFMLKQLEKDYEFGKNIENQKLTDLIKNIMDNHSSEEKIDPEILALVRNIKENGQYTTTKQREVNETYYDGALINRVAGSWVSNAEAIRKKLTDIAAKAQNMVNKANTQLRDGTEKLIYARARQMGYAVQEVKKGTQVQLVLVRCE